MTVPTGTAAEGNPKAPVPDVQTSVVFSRKCLSRRKNVIEGCTVVGSTLSNSNILLRLSKAMSSLKPGQTNSGLLFHSGY